MLHHACSRALSYLTNALAFALLHIPEEILKRVVAPVVPMELDPSPLKETNLRKG